MNRIKIALPEHFPFSTTLTIRITDLNYGGHVGNDVFLSLLHEARQQFLMHHGYKELAIGDIGLIMADAAIEYKKEMNHGDIIRISIAAEGFDKLGFDLLYKMEIIQSEETILAGRAKTGMMCYDYSQKKKAPVPEALIEKLTAK